jgi:hypothetical protein
MYGQIPYTYKCTDISRTSDKPRMRLFKMPGCTDIVQTNEEAERL